MKVLGIGIIVFVCLAYGQQFIPHLNSVDSGLTEVSFGIALIGVLWSYGGWHHASYVSGEVHNAQKVVPKALLAGGLIVIFTYLAVNAAYLSVLSTSEIAGSNAVAAEAMSRVTATGGLIIAILIAFSAFGTAGIYTLSAPRIYFQMGEDRVFFPWLAHLHLKFGTPVKAIILQSTWAALLMIFWGTFESLTTYVVFMDWIFMVLAAMAIFIFRRRKNLIEPGTYKVPLFPIIPLIFIGISIWFYLLSKTVAFE
ncbi:MAG: amino acid permease, partial [Saprospiraceae bacterium]